MQRPLRILSIDGGGVRGIVPATILAYIEEQTGKRICELFDLIAGTSTGGILALGLTKPNRLGEPDFSAAAICEVYEREIPHIFRNPQTWFGNLLMPKYKSFAFQKVLKVFLGDSLLSSALTNVVIPCYDIEHRLPFTFNSRLAIEKSSHDFLMRDVALAASASPTLFHPVRMPTLRRARTTSLVDGGVFANNPALLAVADMKSQPGENEHLFVVSIGTGRSTAPLSDELVSLWGYVQWSRPMLELVMESTSESVHEQMLQLLGTEGEQQYYRLQVELPQDSNPTIDNASLKNMQALGRAAGDYCSNSENQHELQSMCEQLSLFAHMRITC